MRVNTFLENNYRLYGFTLTDLQSKADYGEYHEMMSSIYTFEFMLYTYNKDDYLIMRLSNNEINPDIVFLTFNIYRSRVRHTPFNIDLDMKYFERAMNLSGKMFFIWAIDIHREV